MHDYLFSSEAVRLAFVLGIVVSMAFYQKTQLTTGSIVVPGYTGLFLFLPVTVLATFANALTTYWLVNSVIRNRFVLYGRDRFAVQAVISIGIQAIMLKLSPSVPWLWEADIPLLVGVGYVVPALIAHDMGRQGIKKTTVAVLGSGLVVAVGMLIALFTLPDVRASGDLVGFEVLSFAPHWIPIAVIASALTAWAVNKNFGLRSGGFIGVAYIAALSKSPMQIVFLFAVGIVSWFIVTRLLMKHMILFGRRKFATMMLVSASLAWLLIYAGSLIFGFEVEAYQTLASVALTPIFVPGLLANDMERAGPLRVGAGALAGTAFVLPLTLSIEDLVDTGTPQPVLMAVALVSALVIYHKQWMPLVARWLRAMRLLPRRGRYAQPSLGERVIEALRGGRHAKPIFGRAIL